MLHRIIKRVELKDKMLTKKINFSRFVIVEELNEGTLDSYIHEILDYTTYLIFNVDLIDTKTINSKYFGVNITI